VFWVPLTFSSRHYRAIAFCPSQSILADVRLSRALEQSSRTKGSRAGSLPDVGKAMALACRATRGLVWKDGTWR
jgi:hypothetical protein